MAPMTRAFATTTEFYDCQNDEEGCMAGRTWIWRYGSLPVWEGLLPYVRIHWRRFIISKLWYITNTRYKRLTNSFIELREYHTLIFLQILILCFSLTYWRIVHYSEQCWQINWLEENDTDCFNLDHFWQSCCKSCH